MRRALIAILLILLAGAAFVFFGTKDEIDVTRILLEGKWVSTEDAKFTREFKSDGTIIDEYEGSAPDTNGNWTLFTKEMPVEGFTGELEDEPIYLAIAMPESEALYFKITKIDEGTLEMVYLNRGGTLSFTKIK